MDIGEGKTDALQFVHNIMVSMNLKYLRIQKSVISLL
jgi:hypothetical protein